MDRLILSRRGFMTRSIGGLMAAGLPAWYAQEVFASQQAASTGLKQAGPNDKITMGLIGSGDRCKQLVRDAARQKNFQIVACCDVDKSHREEMAKIIGNNCAQFEDYRDLCARKDIDVVIVATPDHWHALAAIAAMKSGKDVYCEKPLTLVIDEGKALVKVARATNRVLQTGSQQRSDARFRMACELVRNGRIGKIERVETRIGSNPTCKPLDDAPVPEGLNWDFWLGPTPKVDYVVDTSSKERFPPSRCHYQFRWWYDYSGGKMTDWGAHHNDIAQWGLGMDGNGPIAVEGSGDAPSTDGRSYNCHPHFKATYTYANGAKLICTDGQMKDSLDPRATKTPNGRQENHGNGILFIGEGNKWIFVNRGTIAASEESILKEPLPANATRLFVSNDHMRNFMDCLKSRDKPICDVEVGHRSVTVCHLGNIAIRSGKSLKWNPEKEQFVGDESANEWLTRPMRAPWKIEV